MQKSIIAREGSKVVGQGDEWEGFKSRQQPVLFLQPLHAPEPPAPLVLSRTAGGICAKAFATPRSAPATICKLQQVL